MFIPIWLISIAIVFIVAAAFIISAYLQDKKIFDEKEEKKITYEHLLHQAELNKKRVIEKSRSIDKYLQEEKDMVTKMGKDINHLQKIHHDNPQKLIELAHDWMNYSNAVAELKYAKELRHIDWEDNAQDNFTKRTAAAANIIRDVTQRIKNELKVKTKPNRQTKKIK
ncbi:hypothetical protein KBB06_01860 [Candidatus Gracilibacteria bacterium]|nr:hypothetical protein [Candidatus Gracilibacteria bacterium]